MKASLARRANKAIRTARFTMSIGRAMDARVEKSNPSCLAVDLDQIAYVRVGEPGAYKSYAGLKSGKFLNLNNREAAKLARLMAKREAGTRIKTP